MARIAMGATVRHSGCGANGDGISPAQGRSFTEPFLSGGLHHRSIPISNTSIHHRIPPINAGIAGICLNVSIIVVTHKLVAPYGAK